MSHPIPLTKFRGRIKQMATDFPQPMMKTLYETCFSEFDDVDRQFAELKKQGIERLVSAAGVEINFGYRPRRFAGGPGLPPGRYFTVCDSETFNDRGTLRDEITAYYSGSSGITPAILDPLVDTYVIDHLKKSSLLTEEDLLYPFYLLLFKIEESNSKNSTLLGEGTGIPVGERINITYGVRQFPAEIDGVIDLRYPETQQWFLKTFVSLELENEAAAAKESNLFFLPKETIESFEQLLPVIVSLETGGGMVFGQAVGQWLRQNGVNALIFPSARANAFNRVRDNIPVEWGGWNLLIYAGADEPVRDRLFGSMTTWHDRDHDHIRVQHTSEGPEAGSFSIRGVKEFNLLHFDLKKQIACGIRQEDVVAEITGVKNEFLSRAVNAILDKEAAGGSLWYNDVDYTEFVNWHEKLWRDKSSQAVARPDSR